MAIKSQKDLLAGLMFTITGAVFALGARSYDMGTSGRMGPGYFPLMLGVLLAVLGVLVTLQSFGDQPREGEQIGAIAWKPLFFIIGANLIFGLLLGGLPSVGIPAMGLIAAVYGLTFVSMKAGQHFTFKSATVLGTILAAGSYLVFVRLLGLTFQVWPAFIAG
jgi:hypothetical protein